MKTIKEIRAAITEAGGELPNAKANKATHLEALEAAQANKGGKEYVSEASAKQAATLRDTAKLDRRVVLLNTGEVFPNPRHLHLNGIISRPQKARLAKVLYMAAKEGRYPVIEIGDQKFQLAVGVE